MAQTAQSRSSFIMGSALETMPSRPKIKSNNPRLSAPSVNAHQTADNIQAVLENIATKDIHVGPHFNRNILKRYNAQCSNKQPFREPPVSRNFSQRIIVLHEADESDDEWPLARFPRVRPQPQKVEDNSSSQRNQSIGKGELDARLSKSEWSPERGLALVFCSHRAVTDCGTKENEEPTLKSSNRLDLTPPRAVHYSPRLVTPGLTRSINTPSALRDLPTPTSLTALVMDDKVNITSSILRRSVAPVTGLRVQFGPSRVMDDWERDDDCLSDNESLMDPFLQRRV